jgi:hypothetical protein
VGMIGMAAVFAAGIGCTSRNAFRDVAVTRDPSVVAGCQRIDEVRVEKPPKAGSSYETPGRIDTPGRDATIQLTDKARDRGANTLLITDDPPRREDAPTYATGTAYLCAASPATAAPPAGSSGGR